MDWYKNKPQGCQLSLTFETMSN